MTANDDGKRRAGQLALPLSWDGGSTDRAFLLSDANARVVRHLDHWTVWPVRTSVLVGPHRSGKSTLARHFARNSGGRVSDDADRANEVDIFHAWNDAQHDNVPLLLVSQLPPAQWAVALPDLRSRLSAAPVVTLDEPDDMLALALIEAHLAHVGIAYAPDLPSYLHRRIERSYAAIAAVLDALVAASLASGRRLSVPVAKEALHFAGISLI